MSLFCRDPLHVSTQASVASGVCVHSDQDGLLCESSEASQGSDFCRYPSPLVDSASARLSYQCNISTVEWISLLVNLGSHLSVACNSSTSDSLPRNWATRMFVNLPVFEGDTLAIRDHFVASCGDG
jgi:hypothetical protein